MLAAIRRAHLTPGGLAVCCRRITAHALGSTGAVGRDFSRPARDVQRTSFDAVAYLARCCCALSFRHAFEL